MEKIIEENPINRGADEEDKPTTLLHYNANDWLVGMTDPLGRRTDYGHDALGRVTTVTLPLPYPGAPESARSTYTTVYGALGHVVQEIDPDQKATSYEIDDRGRVTKVTLPHDGVNGSPVYQTVYDAAGQAIQEIDPLGRVTRNHFDAFGRLVRTHNPATGTTRFSYDKNSNLTGQTDAAGRVTTFQYDNRDRQAKIIDPRLGETKFEYDNVHNLTKLTDPSENATTFRYNKWNLLERETNQLGASRVYVYHDKTGNLEQVTDRNFRVTQYDYDFQHRLTSEVWRDTLGGPIVRTISHAYDFADQLTSISDPDSAYGYVYDGLGRATTITNLGTPLSPLVVLTQTFDKLSRRDTLAANINGVADFLNDYGYDPLSRMTRVTQTGQGGNAVAAKRVDFGYNLLGQFTSINRYADLFGGSLVASSAYGYETGTQRLTAQKHSSTFAQTGDLANYTWSYDTLGRVKTFQSAKDSSNIASYFYDKTDQLIAVGNSVLTGDNRNWGYDLNGNRTDGQFSTPVSNNNRLVSDGTFNYQYDGEGNLIQRTRISSGAASDKTTLYKWDHRNRLIEVEFKNNGGTTTKHVQYTYDVYDRRIGKKVDSDGNGAFDRSERFVFDQNRDLLFAFLDSDGDAGGLDHSLTHRYLNGAMVDQVLAEELVDGTPGEIGDVYWPLADNLGSNRDVVRRDTVSGTVHSVEHLRFDAFGEILADSNPAYTQRQTYAALEFDADVGLYYAHHRWYDPTTHRFISHDPIGFNGRDVNQSRYVGNRPVDRQDPSGQIWAGIQYPQDPDDPGVWYPGKYNRYWLHFPYFPLVVPVILRGFRGRVNGRSRRVSGREVARFCAARGSAW